MRSSAIKRKQQQQQQPAPPPPRLILVMGRGARAVTDRILHLTLTKDVELLEATSALLALVWVVALALPGDYLQSSFRLLALSNRAPEWLWETIFITLFVHQGSSVLLEGPHNPSGLQNHRVRRIAAQTHAVGVWTLLAFLILQEGFSVPGGVWTLFGLNNFLGAWRVASMYAVDKEVHRLREIQHMVDAQILHEATERKTDDEERNERNAFAQYGKKGTPTRIATEKAGAKIA